MTNMTSKWMSMLYCLVAIIFCLCGSTYSVTNAFSIPSSVYQRSEGMWTMEISSPCTPAERGVVHIVNSTAAVEQLVHLPLSSSSSLYLESQDEQVNDVPMSLSGILPYMIAANKRGIAKTNKYGYFVCENHTNYLETADRPIVSKAMKSTRLREFYGVITDSNENYCNYTSKRDFVLRIIEKPWTGTKLSGDMKQFVQYIEIDIDTNALPDHCKYEANAETVNDNSNDKDNDHGAKLDKTRNRRKKALRKKSSNTVMASESGLNIDSSSQFDLSSDSASTAATLSTIRNEASAEHGFLTIRLTRRKKFVESSKWPISPIWLFAVGMMLVRGFGPAVSKKLGF